MGRRTQITKEQILEAGLQLIIREGYEAIAIKNLAKELNCSTQPISWSFGSIDHYCEELRQYALEYMRSKILGGNNEAATYKKTSEVYVGMAIEEPNLIRYLRSDTEAMGSIGGVGAVFDDEKNVRYIAKWADELEMPEEEALAFIKFFTTYADGVVSLILSGVMALDKETAQKMLDEAEVSYKAYLKTK